MPDALEKGEFEMKKMMLALVFCTCTLVNGQTSTLKAGAAAVNITPPVGIRMSGWVARDKPSQSIADDLYAKAVVLSDSQTTIAILTMDILKTYPDIVDSIRQSVFHRTGIPPQNILIGASHTHFSPLVDLNGSGPYERPYAQTLIGKCAGAIRMAYDRQKPVWIGAGTGAAPEYTFNRRVIQRDGSVINHWRFPRDTTGLVFGPIDPDVSVLKIIDAEQSLVASMIHYCTHPVCGMNEMYSLSADYPAFAMQVIEEIQGGVCLFGLGPSGNQVPIEREGKSRVEIGRGLGAVALNVMQRLPVYSAMPIGVANDTLFLPTKKNKFTRQDTVGLEIQVMAIGDIIFVALPGEVVVELGLSLKKKARVPNLFIIELANGGNVGYILSRQDYADGGYEALNGALRPGSGEQIIERAVALIQSLSHIFHAPKNRYQAENESGFSGFSQKGYEMTKEQLK